MFCACGVLGVLSSCGNHPVYFIKLASKINRMRRRRNEDHPALKWYFAEFFNSLRTVTWFFQHEADADILEALPYPI